MAADGRLSLPETKRERRETESCRAPSHVRPGARRGNMYCLTCEKGEVNENLD